MDKPVFSRDSGTEDWGRGPISEEFETTHRGGGKEALTRKTAGRSKKA